MIVLAGVAGGEGFCFVKVAGVAGVDGVECVAGAATISPTLFCSAPR